jgi:hypothetical protein
MVIIAKHRHPRKGHHAIVKDVLCNQEDVPSGLRVLVRFEKYDPNVPFPWDIFEYDEVVECKYVSQYLLRLVLN